MKNRLFTTLIGGLVLGGMAFAPSMAQTPNAAISKTQAQEIALKTTPGTVHEINLEQEHGTQVWSVAINTPSGAKEVLVDAQSGAIVATTTDNDQAEHEGKVEHEQDDKGEPEGVSSK
jgi:hypothetical protein